MLAFRTRNTAKIYCLIVIGVALASCAFHAPNKYHDANTDFSTLHNIAVLPFTNLTEDQLAAERVRNTFMTALLSTGVVYVIPAGEVARAISRAEIQNPTAPSTDDIAKIAAILKADAIITGVLREYGAVRSGTTTANVISVSMEMIEKETRKIVWSANTTQGGISIWDRLFGGGGRPMNDVTEAAVNDLIKKLLR